MKIIERKPSNKVEELDKVHTNYRIFLAGGCSTDWRDDLIKKLKSDISKDEEDDVDIKTIEVFNPKTSDYNMKLGTLLHWEHNAIQSSEILVINFENSASDQPGTIYELGRFTMDLIRNGKTVIINVTPGYRKAREVKYHIALLAMDSARRWSSIDSASKMDDFIKVAKGEHELYYMPELILIEEENPIDKLADLVEGEIGIDLIKE